MPVLLLTCVAGLALPVKNLLIHGFFGSSSQAVFSLLKGVGLTTEPDLGGSPDALQIRAALPGLTCSGSTRFQDPEPLKANGHADFNACEVQTFGALQWRHLRADYQLRPHWRRVRAHAGMYLSSIEALWFLLAAVPAASLWTAAAGLVARRPASPAVPARG